MIEKIREKLVSRSKSKGVGSVVVAIGMGVALMIGIWVFSVVMSSVDRSSFTSQANSTFDQVTNNVFNAMNLLAVAVIVAAATLILAYFRAR